MSSSLGMVSLLLGILGLKGILVIAVDPTVSIPGTAVAPDLKIETNVCLQPTKGLTAAIKVRPTHGVKRSPVHICCVIDVSYSMDGEVQVKNSAGVPESNGLTTLDLVKHAVRTIIASMIATDQISIVVFAYGAREVLKPTFMNSPAAKAAANSLVEALSTEGTTKLWAGIEKGWNVVRGNKQPNLVTSMFVFTDGQPDEDDVPRAQYLPTIKKYKELNGQPCSVNTFGFGTNLKSDVLESIARDCNGSYVFIPDANYVGTVFINAASNLYNVMATDVKLSIEYHDGFSNVKVVGGHKVDIDRVNSWQTIHIGHIRFDQSLDFVVELMETETLATGEELLQVVLDYKVVGSNESTKTEASIKKNVVPIEGDLQFQIIRSNFVNALDAGIKTIITTKPGLEEAFNLIANSVQIPADYQLEVEDTAALESEDSRTRRAVAGLLRDVHGEVKTAFEVEHFGKWGKHYLRSLCQAHRSQQCNNFKDPGVQEYGGPLSQALQTNFGEIFKTIPPPKPKVKVQSNYSSYGGGNYGGNATAKPTSITTTPVNMANYMSKSAPCFRGDSLAHVVLSGGDGRKEVRLLAKGDKVRTLRGNVATVVCVLETKTPEVLELVTFPDGLVVTLYHPVYDSRGKIWKFPKDMYSPMKLSCSAVYSFVLDTEHPDDHSMMINEVGCVTLGHGVTAEGDIRVHDFFGTHKVLDAMKKDTEGWKSGKVTCRGTFRDENPPNLVNGLDLILPSNESTVM